MRLQVTEADWRKLAPVYFDQLHSSDYLWRFDSLYPGVSGSALLSALAGPRQQPPAADVAMWKWTRGIRAAILENPHVGCFSDVAWIATFLMFDPVATLRYYSTDGRSVFQCGEAIADKAGVPLQVDAAAFRHVGGRYYTDGVHVFGQGELGGTRVRRYFWIVERADPASFTALNLYYARDNERAWYITGKEIRTRSSRSFEIVPWLRLNYRDESRDLSPMTAGSPAMANMSISTARVSKPRSQRHFAIWDMIMRRTGQRSGFSERRNRSRVRMLQVSSCPDPASLMSGDRQARPPSPIASAVMIAAWRSIPSTTLSSGGPSSNSAPI